MYLSVSYRNILKRFGVVFLSIMFDSGFNCLFYNFKMLFSLYYGRFLRCLFKLDVEANIFKDLIGCFSCFFIVWDDKGIQLFKNTVRVVCLHVEFLWDLIQNG